MKKSLLIQATKLSITNIAKHPMYELKTWLHFSFIVNSNKILEWGTNRNGEPAIHFGYHNRIEGNEAKIHSELDAYRKAKGSLTTRKLDEFDIINVRLNRRGEFRLSKPCVCCYSIMRTLGCNSFYYSSEIGWMKC